MDACAATPIVVVFGAHTVTQRQQASEMAADLITSDSIISTTLLHVLDTLPQRNRAIA